ncbi:MAG: selenide, water dikinase SelD [Armatimonadota bacterium]|nr:selenide, water dikinase SelD [bacterium]
MQRSVKLGHCICNPKQGCPCIVFKTKDVCPCAGERLEQAVEDVALTTLVEKAGCASKINQNDLKKVLTGLPEISNPNVLVGTNTCDDAGVYKLSDEMALVQTVDVFTPSVDDPYTFGQIAAANSLSDVYAMGGEPLTALSVIGFPIETLSHRVMTQMLRGGMDKMTEAGVAIVGGHSINDKEPKFGYAVTGVVNPSRIITNAKARPGDLLVLTKPLGVGIISFAGQMGMASPSVLDAAASSMTELNKAAAEVMLKVGVEAATDVTGFGLLGHLGEMATQSGVTAEIYFDQVPVFDEVMDYVSRGVISGGVERNKEHSSKLVVADADITEEMACVLYDPQTSGGLLIAVPEDKVEALLNSLLDRGNRHACVIGRLLPESEARVLLKTTAFGSFREQNLQDTGLREENTMDKIKTDGCCCSNAETDGNGHLPGLATATSQDTQKMMGAFMNSVYAEGAITSRNKELLAIALSVLSKCEPCVKIHINEAKSMGVSEDEISEAIWMAISFGGAPVMMFYRSITEKA